MKIENRTGRRKIRKLIPVYLGVITFLAVICGTLWSKFRAEQHHTAEIEARMAQSPFALPAPTPVAQPQIPPDVSPTPAARIERLEPASTIATEQRAPEPAGMSSAYLRSDMTARARVRVWTSRLSMEGRALTPAQSEALLSEATAELRRETDETARLALNPDPTDAISVAQAKLDLVDRQNETNRRILNAVSTKLTAQQLDGLRAQFDEWHARAKASARAALEQAAEGAR